jgi:hypothetical protein
MRANFGSASTRWSGITDAERAAWIGFADSHPRTDALGQSIKLTGQQMFVAVNASLFNASGFTTDAPPVDLVTTAPGITTFSAVGGGTPAMTLTLDGSGASTDWILIAFSRQVSAGTGFMKTFWQWKSVAGDTTTNTGLLAAYTAQFGTPGTGSRIFVRLTPVSADGWTGTPLITSCKVT